jgi:hypothetical protein
MPVLTAKMAPKALMRRTCRERKEGMLKPDRMVLISGIPEPEAMYITFPPGVVEGVAGAESSVWPLILIWGVEVWSLADGADGRELLVIIVAVELMVPKTSAKPT